MKRSFYTKRNALLMHFLRFLPNFYLQIQVQSPVHPSVASVLSKFVVSPYENIDPEVFLPVQLFTFLSYSVFSHPKPKRALDESIEGEITVSRENVNRGVLNVYVGFIHRFICLT